MPERISVNTNSGPVALRRLIVISRPNLEKDSALEGLIRLVSRPIWGIRNWVAKLFGGHFSVLKSVLLGLSACQKSYRFNPKISAIPINSNVLLLSGQKDLNELLSLGNVRITIGPNFRNEIKDILYLLESPKVKNLLVPSQWVADLYCSLYPSIQAKVRVWASGAEVPRIAKLLSSKMKSRRVLIYAKGNPEVVNGVKSLLASRKIPFCLLTYGAHSRIRFLFELARCVQLIYVARTESQGIALQEAWAMSVNTLVYQDVDYLRQTYGHNEELMAKFASNSFAPYLSKENGGFWRDLRELSSALDGNYSEGNQELRTESDAIFPYPKSHKESMERLLNIIEL